MRAFTCGGIAAAHMLTNLLGLAEAINERLGLFKVDRSYHESDHVLNIAYNNLAGGTRLEHLERVRTPHPPLQTLLASIDWTFSTVQEATHGTYGGSCEVGRVAAAVCETAGERSDGGRVLQG